MRDDWAEFEASGAAVYGINPGSLASHQKFARKLKLPFPLLMDEGRQVSEAYGCLKENGTSVQRTVVIVDKGSVVRYYKRGMPKDEVLLAVLSEL